MNIYIGIPHNVDLRRKKNLFRHYGIIKVLDVGTNAGQYAQLIRKLGFELKSLENGFYNKKTGQLFQVDGIFFRNNQ